MIGCTLYTPSHGRGTLYNPAEDTLALYSAVLMTDTVAILDQLLFSLSRLCGNLLRLYKYVGLQEVSQELLLQHTIRRRKFQRDLENDDIINGAQQLLGTHMLQQCT